ncbi:hypothetical protein [Nocardiopsis ganjiahuensis]|nr:hypothetical protein [Nocardiopsis ganjiahuensis]
MFAHLSLVACKVLDLVEKAIEDDGKTRRLVAVTFAFAVVGVAVIHLLRM